MNRAPHASTGAGSQAVRAWSRAARPLLSCYFPLGDPAVDESLLDIYAACGVDIVELGVPSASPYLDGPDVRASMARAIQAGSDIAACLARIAAWSSAAAQRPAALCMGYPDMDVERVLAPRTLSSLHSLLMLDLDKRPDAEPIRASLRAHGVRTVQLVPPACTDADIAAARDADGYLMLQAASGVTGPRPTLDVRNRDSIQRLRAAGIAAPILLGFGIGTAEQARAAVDLGADGVVIGSMCLRQALAGPAALATFLHGVRTRLNA